VALLLIYLLNRLIFRIKEFLRHWYIKSFFIYIHFVISQLEKIDHFLAFKITLRHLFQPLYQDNSIIGYILGFIFRSSRLLIGAIAYLVIFAVAALFYISWLSILPLIIYQIIKSFYQYA